VPYLSPYCCAFPFLFLTNGSFSTSPFPVWWSFLIFSDVGLFISAFPFLPPARVFYKGLRGLVFKGLALLYQVYLFFAYFSPSDHCLCPLATLCNDFFFTHSETFEVLCEEVNSCYLKE